MFSFAKKYDFGVMIPVLLLMVLGIALIYSATLGRENADMGNTVKQAIAFGMGLFFIWLLTIMDYRIWKNYSGILYIVMIVMLVLVLFLGVPVRGSRSWFSIGGFQLQPAEFAKIILIIALSKYFSINGGDVWRIKHLVITGLYTLIPVGLILVQPDLGSASVLIAIWVGMLVIAGIGKLQALILSLGTVFIVWAGWVFALKDYQKNRIKVFLDPSLDPLKEGYNVMQAKIAIGSGGFWGKGLGHGSQSQLNFLPEQHTDFIFAVLGEELGFAGCLFVFGAFTFLFYRMFVLAKKIKDSFGFFIVVGAGVLILFQVFVNIGMNVGLLPVTGVPLPFLSYGGSSTLAMLMLIGFVQSVAIRTGKSIFPASSRED